MVNTAKGLRCIARNGGRWRLLPNDLPRWPVVYQQKMQLWYTAHVFETMVQDLRAILRQFDGRNPDSTSAVIDSRTIQSTPESGSRDGYDVPKRRKGPKTHIAVDNLGHLLALRVTSASVGDREQVAELEQKI